MAASKFKTKELSFSTTPAVKEALQKRLKDLQTFGNYIGSDLEEITLERYLEVIVRNYLREIQ